jgi:hypothetical protein
MHTKAPGQALGIASVSQQKVGEMGLGAGDIVVTGMETFDSVRWKDVL